MLDDKCIFQHVLKLLDLASNKKYLVINVWKHYLLQMIMNYGLVIDPHLILSVPPAFT